MKYYIFSLLLAFTFSCNFTYARKVKNSFTIEKEYKRSKRDKQEIQGKLILYSDSVKNFNGNTGNLKNLFLDISFAGYEKEISSNKESFILVNSSDVGITGFEVKIDYLDMQDRMLHSRIIKEACFVPPGETRRFDIDSWDLQHTYYYYLGNQPKKVATPYKVVFNTKAIWIDEI